MAAQLAEKTRGPDAASAGSATGAEVATSAFERGAARIGAALRKRGGFTLAHYRASVVARRLELTFRRSGESSLDRYLERIECENGLQDAFLADLSVWHSEFFRNADVFARLADSILPAIFASRPPWERVRILSLGCARGEEPYSLAMLALERFAPEVARGRLEIAALDFSADCVEHAWLGVFRESRLERLDPALRARHFRPLADGQWRVSEEARRLVTFGVGDLFSEDLGCGTCDLVLFRNVLVYLTREAQLDALRRVRQTLRPGGYLVLGKSESFPVGATAMFEPISRGERVFRRPRDGDERVMEAGS